MFIAKDKQNQSKVIGNKINSILSVAMVMTLTIFSLLFVLLLFGVIEMDNLIAFLHLPVNQAAAAKVIFSRIYEITAGTVAILGKLANP